MSDLTGIVVPGAKPRGRPFQPGNPGRPRGARNKVTQWLESLAQDQAEQLVQKVLEQARAGDVASQRMMLDRVYPAPKAPPIQVNVPPIKTPQDVHAAIAAILNMCPIFTHRPLHSGDRAARP